MALPGDGRAAAALATRAGAHIWHLCRAAEPLPQGICADASQVSAARAAAAVFSLSKLPALRGALVSRSAAEHLRVAARSPQPRPVLLAGLENLRGSDAATVAAAGMLLAGAAHVLAKAADLLASLNALQAESAPGPRLSPITPAASLLAGRPPKRKFSS